MRSPAVQNFAKELQPGAITRDLDWGIKIPLDGWEDNNLKRIHVWFDAVIGYLSASIEWAKRTGDPDAWKTFWPGEQAKSYYFMGKDNIVFHSVIWPSILLGVDGQGDKAGRTSEWFGTLAIFAELDDKLGETGPEWAPIQHDSDPACLPVAVACPQATSTVS